VPEERLDTLIRTLLAVGGGALALSMAIFLRSESLELSADLVAALQASWLALFYALGACVALQALRLLDAASRARRLLARLLGATALLAFLAGLALLAAVSVVALSDANSDEDDSQAVRYVI
jgi:hypothetical protein